MVRVRRRPRPRGRALLPGAGVGIPSKGQAGWKPPGKEVNLALALSGLQGRASGLSREDPALCPSLAARWAGALKRRLSLFSWAFIPPDSVTL